MSIGLFGTLGLAARSLQTQQAGLEVTGHNLANVNNPAYARQRLNIATTPPVSSPIGPLGTGAQAVAIQQIRSVLVDRQIMNEGSVAGFWGAHQLALEFAQTGLGQQVNRLNAAGESAAQRGLAEGLAELFAAFQSVSLQPSSLAERQVLLQKAQTLATQFNEAAQRLANVRAMQDETLTSDTASANLLLADVADLNDQIVIAEINSGAVANDLRDLRQQKIEELAKLVNLTAAPQANGAINLTIGGVLMVEDKDVRDSLAVYDAGSGQLLVRAATAGTALALSGGSIAGAISVRDGPLATAAAELNSLATLLISEVNARHASGFSLTGSTGAAFFTGTDAATIGINAALAGNPALFQASNASGEAGNNAVAVDLAQLAEKVHAGLGNQTFAQRFSQTVAALGQSLATANNRVADQKVIGEMLEKQRASISGVSMDEEMVNLTTYQRAYQASARLMTVVDVTRCMG